MKLTSLVTVSCLAFVLAIGAVGCKKNPNGVTPLPYSGATPRNTTGGNAFPPVPTVTPINTAGDNPFGKGIDGASGDINPMTGNHDINDPARARNTDQFAADTVYFALDKAIVEQKEMGKISNVAEFIRKNPDHDILVEGHCDERGTEGYNLALGDRRALAIREALISAGAPADNVHTVSYGESRPADPGHTQAAWAKNRRGAFVLVLPAK
jgi:peptidoglycan-associated lipoprotein